VSKRESSRDEKLMTMSLRKIEEVGRRRQAVLFNVLSFAAVAEAKRAWRFHVVELNRVRGEVLPVVDRFLYYLIRHALSITILRR
jgi:hypothetical protein